MKWYASVMIALLFVGCGDGDAICPLNCSSARRATQGTYELKWVSPSGNTINCPVNRTGSDLDPMRVEFKLESTDDASLGSFVSFDPKILGLMSETAAVEAGNSVLNSETNEYSTPWYHGVATPSDEWCTDSCGIGTLTLVPKCPPSGEKTDVSLRISSGSFTPEDQWKVTVNTD